MVKAPKYFMLKYFSSIWNGCFESWFWDTFKAGHLKGALPPTLSLSDLLPGLEAEPGLPHLVPRDAGETTPLGFT